MRPILHRCLLIIAILALLIQPGSAQAAPGAALPPETYGLHLEGHFGGSMSAVAVQGQYAYLGTGYRFEIIDISDPANPARMGSIDLPGSIVEIAVSGSYAFVLIEGGSEGLIVICIADPLAPRVVGDSTEIFVPTPTNGLVIDGNYLYAATGEGGLYTLDISNPAQPNLLAAVETPGDSYDLAAAGDYVYVADLDSGLTVFDISIPEQPQQVASIPTLEYIFSITVDGDYAYLINANSVNVVDIQDPEHPVLVIAYETPMNNMEIAKAGNTLYITTDNNGLVIIDVTYPTQPELINVVNDLDANWRLTLSGSYLYAANGYSLSIISISDPIHPAQVALLKGIGPVRSISVNGNYAYLTDDYYGLSILDISIRDRPRLIHTLALEIWNAKITTDGGYAYVIGNYYPGFGMSIIDIHDPLQAAVVSTIHLPEYYSKIAISGNTALITSRDLGLLIYDISDPRNPSLVRTVDTTGTARKVVVQGTTAYVTDGSAGLAMIDITNPNQANLLTTIDTPGLASDIILHKNYAYVVDSFAGLSVIDISDPGQARLVTTVSTLRDATRIVTGGSYAYLTGSSFTLAVVDLRNPAQPSPIQWITGVPNPQVWDIAMAGETIYLSKYFDGLEIYHYRPAQIYLPLIQMQPGI